MNKREIMQEIGISVVIGSYNRKQFLKLTIETLRDELSNAAFPSEIIVIDGGSTDGTLDWLLKQKDIITIVQHNRGIWNGKELERRSWGYFINLAFKASQGKYVCMLSDDCLVIKDSIKNGYNFFESKLKDGIKLGAVAFYFRDWPVVEKYAVANNLDQLYVNHGMYLNKALKEVNYCDEDTFIFYYGDTDLIIKMVQKGYVCLSSENSFIEHHAHANVAIRKTNESVQNKDMISLLNKWEGILFDKSKREEYVNRIGFWKYSDFIDTNNTYKKFLEIDQSWNFLDLIRKAKHKLFN